MRPFPRVVAIGLLGAGLAAPLAVRSCRTLYADSYMSLYAGRWIADHGIPRHEPFAVEAAGRAWIDQQWLAQLATYGAWSAGGYRPVALLSVLLICSAFAFLAVLMHRRGASLPIVMLSTLLATSLASGHVFIRAQSFAFPCFVGLAWICLIDDDSKRVQRRWVWLLPLLVVWANLHGSAILGAALAGAFLAHRAVIARPSNRWSIGALAILCSLTPLATPYGLDVIEYYGALLGNSAVKDNIAEWQPASVPGDLPYVAPLGLAGLSWVLAARRGYRADPIIIAWTVIMALAFVLAVRNQPWYGLAVAVLFADTAALWMRGMDELDPRILGSLVAAVALVGLVGVVGIASRTDSDFEGETSPVVLASVLAHLREDRIATVLGDPVSAAALLWRDPRLAGRIAFEARLEQYPEEALDRWYAVQRGDRRVLADFGETYSVLVSSKDSPRLSAQLAHASQGRHMLVRDGGSIATVSTRR